MNLERALHYAKLGIPVFPCRPCRAPYISNGFKGATTEEEQIQEWWQNKPDALLGVPTGEVSGLYVIDLDMKNSKDGVAAFEKLCAGQDSGSPVTYTTMTGGGKHLCYRHRPGLGCTVDGLGSGVDTRGDGGYVVLHQDIDFTALPSLPEWLYAKCASLRGRSTVSVSDEAVAAELVPGEKRRAITEDELTALAAKLERSARGVDQLVGKDLRAVLRGDAWGEKGKRETALFHLGLAVSRAFPEMHADSTAMVFQASCTAVALEDNSETTVKWVASKLRHCDSETARSRAVIKSGTLDHRPEVAISFREQEIVDKVATVLGADECIFQRNRALVSLGEDPSQPALGKVIIPMSQEQLRLRITANVKLMISRKGEMVETRPEGWLIGGVFKNGTWPTIRPIAGLVSSPTLREDGSLLTDEGYDPATMLYLTDSVPVNVPVHPTQEQAEAARDTLLTLIQDFPLQDVDVSVWLALVLTRIARRAVRGQTPVFVLNASTAGAGKTLLGELACVIATGRKPNTTTPTEDQDEMRKALLAIAVEGHDCVFFDNVSSTGKFGGAVLDQAVTGVGLSGRNLGKTQTISGELKVTWIATGNNVTLAGDGARRTVWCRLCPEQARPENRTGFAISDVLEYATDNRAELLSAALTILRGFHCAGRPKLAKRLGSFENWSDLIASACVWVGLPDPTTSQSWASKDDPKEAAMYAVCSSILELQSGKKGVLVGELFKRYDVMSEALEYYDEGKSVGGKWTSYQLGGLLKSLKDKVLDLNGKTYRVTYRTDPHNNSTLWKMEHIDKG